MHITIILEDRILQLLAGVLLFLSACAGPVETRSGTEGGDDQHFREILDSPSLCRDCVSTEPVFVLGDTERGFLEETGGTDDIVVDGDGNYWVGQRGFVRVFDSRGAFLRDVGRPGQGPMEFQRPRPVHRNKAGQVHILDNGNLRETIVDTNFQLVAERRLPEIAHTEAALDSNRYVAQMWIKSAERLGYPLPIVANGEVIQSFGVSTSGSTGPLTPFTSERVLTTDPSTGYIVSSKLHDYSIEVWTAKGERVMGLEGPLLNTSEVLPGRFTVENPFPNRIFDLHVDAASRLWILIWELRPNWQDGTKEMISPTGQVALVPKNDDLSLLYRTRIDVVNLQTSSRLGVSKQHELFFKFLDDETVAELQYASDGNIQIGISRLGDVR